MNKKQLWLLLVKTLNYNVHNAHILSIINILLDELVKELINGEEIKIINFGTFYIKTIRPKHIKSIVSGNIMTTKETKAIRFRLSRTLARELEKEEKDNV
jgi:nucleoid DNA-binding protein